MTVYSESGKSLLRVGSEHGGEINGAGTLRTVETPDSLGPKRIHVHSLGTVAPARCHRDSSPDTLALEFFSAGRAFGHTANCAVSYDALDGSTIRVLKI